MNWQNWNFYNEKIKFAQERDEALNNLFEHMAKNKLDGFLGYKYLGEMSIPEFDSFFGSEQKMNKVWEGFELGLSVEQVSAYAYPQYSYAQMDFMMRAFEAGVPVSAMEVFLQTAKTGEALHECVLAYENNPDSLEVFEARLEKMKGEAPSTGKQARSAASHVQQPYSQVASKPAKSSVAAFGDISSLAEFYDTITKVVNHMVEVAAENSTSGNWTIGYDDVSDLITENDFNRFFQVIAGELESRKEVLDLQADGFEGHFDFVIGLAWCKNYEPLLVEEEAGIEFGDQEVEKRPLLADLIGASNSRTVIQTDLPDRVEIWCYANQVLPSTAIFDAPEMVDEFYAGQIVVKREWAEEMAKKHGFPDLEEFLNEYTWDNTDGWYEQAFCDHALLGMSVGAHAYEERDVVRNFDRSNLQVEPSEPQHFCYKCKACGDEIEGDSFYDLEEDLWGHLQMTHPEIFEECQDWETPYMLEEYYDDISPRSQAKQQNPMSFAEKIIDAKSRAGSSQMNNDGKDKEL